MGEVVTTAEYHDDCRRASAVKLFSGFGKRL